MAIEGHMDKITAHTWFSTRKKEKVAGQEPVISRQLAPAEILIAAHLPEETLRMRDLGALREGDLLLTSHPQEAPVLVSVEGRPKFLARLGSLKDRKAVKVVSAIDPAREATIHPPRAAMTVRKGESPGGEGAAAAAPDLVGNLLNLPLTASVVVAEKTLRVKDVLALKVGEIIEFVKREDEPLEMRVGERRVGEGTTMKIGEKFGLQITTIRNPRDTILALGP